MNWYMIIGAFVLYAVLDTIAKEVLNTKYLSFREILIITFAVALFMKSQQLLNPDIPHSNNDDFLGFIAFLVSVAVILLYIIGRFKKLKFLGIFFFFDFGIAYYIARFLVNLFTGREILYILLGVLCYILYSLAVVSIVKSISLSTNSGGGGSSENRRFWNSFLYGFFFSSSIIGYMLGGDFFGAYLGSSLSDKNDYDENNDENTSDNDLGYDEDYTNDYDLDNNLDSINDTDEDDYGFDDNFDDSSENDYNFFEDNGWDDYNYDDDDTSTDYFDSYDDDDY
jgi:hypothetical protein